jgi:acetamidase/formamidase
MNVPNFPFTALRWITTLAAGGLWASATLVADDEVKYDHYVPSKWNTVTWGIYSAEYAPVMRVKSGEVVKIDIANPAGMNRLDPKKFLVENKIPFDQPAIQDLLEVCEKTPLHPSGLRGALLTGPVYIEGAEPGDSLEVRVLDIRFRLPYGVNSTAPGNGHPLADLVPRPWVHKYDLDLERSVALFKAGQIELPLAPFMGQMGVAPPPSAGAFGASPPTPLHGGNFDLQELDRGGTLFLPVNVAGALFFTGNGHALQGNGEITNPSLEVNLTGYFQFVLHKKETLTISHMETPTHYVFVGIHDSLDEAMRSATKQCVEFLQKKEGLDFYDAYALTSLTTDFTVARALLPAQMVYALVPKHIFKNKTDYWYKGPVPTKY